ncbi:MAG TPA: methyltransferase domain-containing protein [Alphaproteobacteria bacterium]|nr:methyltransferase domain-containing protein [Alphaproteobacteria bacterium]HNS44014.1 methyltransferase domain-containing protein [Alphaproteobacteria bacterium]
MTEAHEAFGRAIATYDDAAEIQKHSAHQLSLAFPNRENPVSLELGSGTGLMTNEFFRAYDNGQLLVTDANPSLVAHCSQKFKRAASMTLLAEEALDRLPSCSFDLIFSNMVFQWVSGDPNIAIARLQSLLAPDGVLVYATIGHRNFHRWRAHLKQHGLESGMREDLPEVWLGQYHEEIIPRDYGSARGFLDMLKRTGAHTSREGYLKHHMRAFKHACDQYDGSDEWHVVYGMLHASHAPAP